MTTQQIRLAILRRLRHGPLNGYEIADEINQAPFRVNAELRCLKRERFVTERLTPTEHQWRLTDRGHEFVNHHDQLRAV